MRWALAAIALAAAPLAASAGTLRGTVAMVGSEEAVSGGVVVVTTSASADGFNATTITEDDGTYRVPELPAGTYLVTLYFGDVTMEHPDVVVADGDAAEVVVRFEIDPDAGYDCWYIEWPSEVPTYNGKPDVSWGTRGDDVPLVWRRDQAGRDALDARLDGARTATSIDRASRLPGAPAVALELIELQDTSAGFSPLEHAAGAGGAEALDLVHGHNTLTGAARLALARQSRLSAIVAGALDEDRAWWSNGVVLDQTADGVAVQGLGTIDLAADAQHQLAGSALYSHGPDGRSDGWIETFLSAKSDDYHREIEVGLVAERLDTGPVAAARAVGAVAAPRVVDRLGGRLLYRRRVRNHEAILGGELGAGRADGTAHSDVRAFAGDTWSPRPNWTVDAGVRWDRRVVGGATVEVWAPRLAIAWDPTKEGDSSWFAGVERAAHLDERGLGAWRDGDLAADTALAGYTRRWHVLRWSAAVRSRRTVGDDRYTTGVEGTARLDAPRKNLHTDLTVSSLERAATLTARWTNDCCDADTLQLSAIARAAPDGTGWGVGANLRHGSSGDRDLHVTIGLEAFDLQDEARRSAHLVISASY